MKVRVFVPRATDPADGSTFSGTDYNFPVLPSIGHVLRFTDDDGDFTVASVGFVQDDEAFLAAVWLEAGAGQYMDPNEEGEPGDRYRDLDVLNSDMPPDSMPDY